MSLSKQQSLEIYDLLAHQIRRKLADYKLESSNMPFHTRLLGKDRMALFSFIQSINTTLGTSVFEQVAVIIAKPHFKQAISQYKGLDDKISPKAQRVIQDIMDDLRTSRKRPDKAVETAEILKVALDSDLRQVKRPRIDLFVEAHDGTELYFDLKTAKPNMGDFVGYKRMLLEWVAIRGVQNPNAKVRTLLAIPYNPYEPDPYERWTLQGLFNVTDEILVAEEFWDFLGGENAYDDLLVVFEKVGMTLRPEIDARFTVLSNSGL
jgi:hypothetical protein